jgi:hypothetical protein
MQHKYVTDLQVTEKHFSSFEELHNLYFSQNIIRMIKSRRMRWAGHVA